MNTFTSIRIEGGLLALDILDKLVSADLPGQRPADFELKAQNLTNEIAAAWGDAKTLWGVFQSRLSRMPEDDLATRITRDSWVNPFMGLLGYEIRFVAKADEVDGMTFAISHRTDDAEDAPPIHIVGIRQELGRVPASGRPRMAPHSLLQEYLNRTEHLWGIVTNGQTLRLLRDCTFVRRQAYVEFDLQAMFEEQRFQDFVAFYRLLHRTRLPKGIGEARECLLEKYFSQSVEQGGRVREHLRDGVETCITSLANGFLKHKDNEALRSRLSPDYAGNDRIAVEDLYRQLLRLVYRFLFLLVSEERGLISRNPLYREHYGIARLRRMLDLRGAYTHHDDLWQSLRVLWKVLGDDRLADILAAAPLNGDLFGNQDLDNATIANKDLLTAFRYLAYYRESASSPFRRVNYGALDVEELGSVYESLLDFHPAVTFDSMGRADFSLIFGSERKTTGSYYTPPELVGELIKSALEPVLAERVKAAPTSEAKQKAILAMKVCDPACGSGHFLLAAARRLGKALAAVRTGEDEPTPESLREAIRDVIAHCIYGVDLNPLAVDLCRVALWLESHCGGKPLTFLDHRIRNGDSLVGMFDVSTLKDGIPDKAFEALEGDDKPTARQLAKRNKLERAGGADLFTSTGVSETTDFSSYSQYLDTIANDTTEEVRTKKRLFEQSHADPAWLRQKRACDLWTAAFFQPIQPDGTAITTAALRDHLAGGSVDPRILAQAEAIAHRLRSFHWSLEFPEVFAKGGFDVVLGNPPFMGGGKISTAFGKKYCNFLRSCYDDFESQADLCALFFRKSFSVTTLVGRFGLIATNSIGQGDTRICGLAWIIKAVGEIQYARRFVKWPGIASVEVNILCISKSSAPDEKQLDYKTVSFISSRLDSEPESEPFVLMCNGQKSFKGNEPGHSGLVLSNEEAIKHLEKFPSDSSCLLPYLIGDDLNSSINQEPTRYVICFHDWDISKAMEYRELFRIVETKVMVDKLRSNDKREKDKWWQFRRYPDDLSRLIKTKSRILVRSRVSELHMLSFAPTNWIIGDAAVVFIFDDYFHFSLLQSSIHEAWVLRNSSSLESRTRYTPSDCFETFPFPQEPPVNPRTKAAQVGELYHEYRRQVMVSRQLGLTKTYNLFHMQDYIDDDIVEMRRFHKEMDQTILECYGWDDLDLGYDFHVNDRGQTRYTLGPESRREILRRLLELNLSIAEQEKRDADT